MITDITTSQTRRRLLKAGATVSLTGLASWRWSG